MGSQVRTVRPQRTVNTVTKTSRFVQEVAFPQEDMAAWLVSRSHSGNSRWKCPGTAAVVGGGGGSAGLEV